MRSRVPATADLFAAAEAPAARQPTPPPSAAAVSPPPPPQQEAARPRSRHLWYAVVFPALGEPEGTSRGALERLCLHAQRFTPWVSIEPPNALLLEIRGSVKLFGSLAALHADIDAAWSGLKLRAQSSTAPSTLAALWLARAGQKELIEDPGLLAGRLAKLPVACTAWDSSRLATLRTLGVNRIGELMRLPRAGIARRFGPAAVLDLDIALSRQSAPRRAFVARERFRERCDFETEVETVVYVQKALEPLIERCARFLRERQAGVQALELKLRHRTQPLTRIRLGLASVTCDPLRLADVSMQKLSRLELAAPILSLELLSGRLQPLSGRFSRCVRLPGRCRRPRHGAATGGASARPAGRAGGLWHLPGAGASPRGGLAASACTAGGRCAAARPAGSSEGRPRGGDAAAGVAFERTGETSGCRRRGAASQAARCSSKAPSASRAAGGTARMSRAITTSCARRAALGCGFSRNGDPGAGMCTVCSLEAPGCTPSFMP